MYQHCSFNISVKFVWGRTRRSFKYMALLQCEAQQCERSEEATEGQEFSVCLG